MPGMGQPKHLSISQTRRFHIQGQPFITSVLRLAVIWKHIQRLSISENAEGFLVSWWVSFLFKIHAKWKLRDGTMREEENQASKQGKEVLCHAFHWSSVQVRSRNWWAQCICKPTARNLTITCKAYSKVKMSMNKDPGCDSLHKIYVIYKWFR